MRSLPLIPLLLLLAVSLAAQGIPTIQAHPPLPFGIEWKMTEREALAALKSAGVEMELVEEGTHYTEREARERAELYGVSVQQMRDQKTWHRYVAGNVQGDSLLPVGRLAIEFYRNQLLRVRFAFPTESREQHLALTDTLAARYSAHYGTGSAQEWKELPSFPTGVVILDQLVAASIEPPSRPVVFRGWSGRVGNRLYGTTIYNASDDFLVVEQMIGTVPKSTGRRGR